MNWPKDEDWPPDYVALYAWRQATLIRFREDPTLLAAAKIYYALHPDEFIGLWMDTYDPRNAGTSVPTFLPFVLFERQREYIQFLIEMLAHQQSGLAEKSRDMGATYCAGGLAIWLFIFYEGSSVGFGSLKELKVDKIGDPDSIFEKLRLMFYSLPREFLPVDFSVKKHCGFMNIVNPENGSTITGESGMQVGRGGRKTLYILDEAGHYMHAESVEAAIGDNTKVPIYLSSASPPGTMFHRKRESGIQFRNEIERGQTHVFRMSWHENPLKDQQWYDERRAKAEREGILHIFAREVDIDYFATQDDAIIQAIWIRSAIDAHLKLGFSDSGQWFGALDVADSGGDANAIVLRKGVVLRAADEWRDRDTTQTTHRAIKFCGNRRVDLQYDCIGVGAGVKGESNRILREIRENGEPPPSIEFVAWNAAASPLYPDQHLIADDPESPLIGDHYKNLKAQAWDDLARRFEKTHNAITKGIAYNPDELISIDSRTDLLHTIEKELVQPTMGFSATGKMIVNKTPDGTRSPNVGDAIMMAFYPIVGSYTLENL